MASSGSFLLSLLVLSAGLQLSACLLKEMKGLRAGWNEVRQEEHVLLQNVVKRFPSVNKRASGDPPVLDGDHLFDDGYTHARVHYSGGKSTVIFVLTYNLGSNNIPFQSNLYRSVDYGAHFSNINSLLGSSGVVLSPAFFFSDFNQNFLLFAHATESRFYYTFDEGESFTMTEITSVDISTRTIKYHPTQDGWMMALDSTSALYVTRDFGQHWNKVDDNVAFYQWADIKYDENPLTVYYTTSDPNNEDVTSNLFISLPPYTTHEPFDPNLGTHDAFLLYGPYIFAQRTDAGKVNLYVSHLRKPFQLAKIPTPYNHLNYLVGHIDELLAMVVIEHEGGFYNLYLSDTTGVYFALSLQDMVVERNYALDLEVIDGVNGTLIANQYVRDDPSVQNAPIRTLISLDNGGFWELIHPPDVDVNHRPLNCEPPSCSLHLHMGSSDYARLGVYSTDSAPGLIIAHGTANRTLMDDPDLYISRDGGITWEETLSGSWGVNVADHGGLIVAARDYHQEVSTGLMYSCNEGFTWTAFQFSSTPSTIYGVLTEPGHHTTVMSLYGTSRQNQWRVFTVNFTSIFERICFSSDYTQWMPWDSRSDTDCILGSSVTIEKRKALTCCLNGRDYDREILIVICECNGEDFECDYGYERHDLTGPCIKDPDVSLPDPCANGKANYTASAGYRKIAGDVCKGGGEGLYAPYTAPCCGNTTLPPTFPPSSTSPSSPSSPSSEPPSSNPTTSKPTSNTTHQQESRSDTGPLIGTGVVIAILGSAAGVLLTILVVVALKYSSLHKRHLRLITAGEGPTHRFAFHSDRGSSSEPLTHEDDPTMDTEDDAPLVP